MARYLDVIATVTVSTLLLAGCGERKLGPAPAPTAAPTATPGPIEQLPVNETVQTSGLGGSTDVVFDEYGIPHVFAPDTGSALFVQGYLTAATRFWEMDVFRRIPEGRLSAVFGRPALNTDVAMRTVFTTRDGRR